MIKREGMSGYLHNLIIILSWFRNNLHTFRRDSLDTLINQAPQIIANFAHIVSSKDIELRRNQLNKRMLINSETGCKSDTSDKTIKINKVYKDWSKYDISI